MTHPAMHGGLTLAHLRSTLQHSNAWDVIQATLPPDTTWLWPRPLLHSPSDGTAFLFAQADQTVLVVPATLHATGRWTLGAPRDAWALALGPDAVELWTQLFQGFEDLIAGLLIDVAASADGRRALRAVLGLSRRDRPADV